MTASVRKRKGKRSAVATVEDVAWLNRVREVRHPIDLTHPLTVRLVDCKSGPPLPQPSVPFPERHPYCEIGFNFEGRLRQFIGTETRERTKGDLLLMGPGTPHNALYLSYPQRSVTVHFLPIFLFEMGPEYDGGPILARFTTTQSINKRIILLPLRLREKLGGRFEQMAAEFSNKRLGSEFRLRALLMETLVDILRFEEISGAFPGKRPAAFNWVIIEKALRFLHHHYDEPLYIETIARAVGLSVSRLQVTFREALGMSCVHYLRALRISRAKALLSTAEARVTDVALQVGFETLSHFNVSFRNLIGMSPTEYMRQASTKTKLNSAQNR